MENQAPAYDREKLQGEGKRVMPIYSYKCPKCEKVEEKMLPLRERNEEQKCECGEIQERVLDLPSPPVFRGTDFTPKFHK